jgi:hypothetical protein
MSQFYSVFGACYNTLATGNTSIGSVIKRPLIPFIQTFQGLCGAVYPAGRTPGADLIINPNFAKKKYDHQNHGLSAEDMECRKMLT